MGFNIKEERQKITFYYLVAILIFLSFQTWIVIRPFIDAIMMAGIFVGCFLPFSNIIRKKYPKLNDNHIALISTLVILVVGILPLIFVATQLIKEITHLYGEMKSGMDENFMDKILAPGGFLNIVQLKLNEFGIDVSMVSIKEKMMTGLQSGLGSALGKFNSVIQNIFQFIVQFFIMIVAIYAFFKDGKKLKRYIFALSPLEDSDEELILSRFNQMNYVTMYVNGIGGVIQGFFAGIGFAIVGFESVFLWTSMMIILAFIPVVGMSIIYIPACIILWYKGMVIKSIGLFIFCTLIALFVENVYKPKFMGEKISVNSMILLLFILGGMSVFGPLGIFYGPILCILFSTVVNIYIDKFEGTK